MPLEGCCETVLVAIPHPTNGGLSITSSGYCTTAAARPPLDRGQGGVEDLRRHVDLVVADRQGRRHAEAVCGAAGAAADQVDRQAAALALLAQLEPKRLGGAAALAVLDQLEAAQEAHAAHVADRLVAALELAQVPEQALAGPARSARQVLVPHHLEDGQRGGRRERVGDVRGDVHESTLVA
jgi:hypothetical protein